MKSTERGRLLRRIRNSQSRHLESLAAGAVRDGCERKLRNFDTKYRAFLRTEVGSANSIKQVPRLGSLAYGIMHYQRQQGINPYGFSLEFEEINRRLTLTINQLAGTNYEGRGSSYGEALLNCYLDVYVTFTMLREPRLIPAYPKTLVNPLAGLILEIDTLFEGFKLAFEFQGDASHFDDAPTSHKDEQKRTWAQRELVVLIPVNICQLSDGQLSSLICNSIKEQTGLLKAFNYFDVADCSRGSLGPFCKTLQRMDLAHRLYGTALPSVDARAGACIGMAHGEGWASALQDAPRVRPHGRSGPKSRRAVS